MSLTLKAILLAADGYGSKKILGVNKCFLEVRKVPSFIRVLTSLSDVEVIDEVWIVGPEYQIKKALRQHIKNISELNKIFVISQELTIIDNLKKVLELIQTNYFRIDKSSDFFVERSVLIVPGDIPMVTPDEIKEFILKHEKENSDYSIGVISKDKMQIPLKSGVKIINKLLFFPFKENSFRINNLHLVQPSKIKNLDLIEKLYLLRHNKRLCNVVLIIAELISKGYFKSVYFYMCIQFSMLFNFLGFVWLHDRTKRLISIKQIEKVVSVILGAKVVAVESSYCGAVLDMDSEEDYFYLENFEIGEKSDR